MADESADYQKLNIKLQALERQQEFLSKQIADLKQELAAIMTNDSELNQPSTSIPEQQVLFPPPSNPLPAKQEASTPKVNPIPSHLTPKPSTRPSILQQNWEKLIGENLISKLGILITILGVAVGVKYSIEKNLISPIARIILGYLSAITLLGFGIKLKEKYESYSAVLVSGAIAIMYFLTYASHAFYGLIPQAVAFGLMVIFTAFSVVTAFHYNRQIIALLGMVGAYGVPFLLSDGSGKVGILFSYMAFINVGILIIAFKKYWKLLHYTSFGLTWFIFIGWFVSKYSNSHFGMAFCFLAIFFLIFYAALLGYKVIQRTIFTAKEVSLLLSNAFIFFGIGYLLLADLDGKSPYLGLFAVGNAAIHFGISSWLYRLKLADQNLLRLLLGLVLVFITLAIPIQLNAHAVTLLWAFEAGLLFWIGRTKGVVFYEKLAYPLMVLALGSLLQDYQSSYAISTNFLPVETLNPILNIQFLSSILFIAAFYWMHHWNSQPELAPKEPIRLSRIPIPKFTVEVILLLATFSAFRMEIINYWTLLYHESKISLKGINNTELFPIYNTSLIYLKSVWLIIYMIIFSALGLAINLRKFKNPQLGNTFLVLAAISIVAFLLAGLINLGKLREDYLLKGPTQYYIQSGWNLTLRYLGYSALALLLWNSYRQIRAPYLTFPLKQPFNLVLYVTILWIASSELIHLMQMAASTQSYKLGLSILWGIYALIVVAIGIRQKNKTLRFGALGLFGITLVKLFFYDISHLNTLGKTIVFVSLGVLLLIISFLYNKYKAQIQDEDKG